MNAKIPAEIFARILDYGWEGAPAHRGWLAEMDDKILGYQGSVGSSRKIDGVARPCGSFSSLYVHKSARGHDLGGRMMRALVAEPDVTYTVFNPSRRVQALLESCGFSDLETHRRVFVAGPAGKVEVAHGAAVAPYIDAAILRDHVGLPVSAALLSDADGAVACLLGAPARGTEGAAIELLYTSDPTNLARMIEAAAPALLGSEPDLRLHVDERYFAGNEPGGQREPLAYRRMIRPARDPLPAWRVDHLYSETLLLGLKLG
ncbi:MAG: GNAT family N-acetyltransferase [Pseudomonadota bacterium]